MAFKSSFLAENGEDKYFELENEIGSIDIEYLNDIIYVSLIEEANTCANYDGNISVRDKNITLLYHHTNPDGDTCTSQSIYRFSYVIDNSDLLEYTFMQE